MSDERRKELRLLSLQREVGDPRQGDCFLQTLGRQSWGRGVKLSLARLERRASPSAGTGQKFREVASG